MNISLPLWPLLLQELNSAGAAPDATARTPGRNPSEPQEVCTPSPAIKKAHTFQETPSATKPEAPRRNAPNRQDTLQSLFLGSEEGDTPEGKQDRKKVFSPEEKQAISNMSSCKALPIDSVLCVVCLKA